MELLNPSSKVYGKPANIQTRTYPNGDMKIKTYSIPYRVGNVVETKEKKKRGTAVSESNLKRTIRRVKAKTYDYAKANVWTHMVTFTLDQQKVENRYDYSLSLKELGKQMNKFKRKYPELKYLLIPEQHKDGAWHYHGLVYVPHGMELERCKKGVRKQNSINNNLGYQESPLYGLGIDTWSEIKSQEAVSKYIMKYITKDLLHASLNKKRYLVSKNCVLPEISHDYVDDLNNFTNGLKMLSKSSFQYDKKLPDGATNTLGIYDM